MGIVLAAQRQYNTGNSIVDDATWCGKNSASGITQLVGVGNGLSNGGCEDRVGGFFQG